MKTLLSLLPVALLALFCFSLAPVSLGTSPASYHATNAFECNFNPDVCPGASFGNNGVLKLGGGGATGTVSFTLWGHNRGTPANPIHIDIQVTGWDTEDQSYGLTTFVILSGTVTCSGPGSQEAGPGCGVSFPLDSGIPSTPGHYTIFQLGVELGFPAGYQFGPGIHYNVNVIEQD